MAINFDTALSIHPQALKLREQRSEVLAANLANADTPGFKARDLDFQAVLKGELEQDLKLNTTHEGHLLPYRTELEASLRYRNPNQPSLDGNTVEEHIEEAKYAENAVQYQASLRFINGKFSSLKTAIRGESV